jgi:hypothetical protein
MNDRADTIEIALDPVTAGKKLLRDIRRERAAMQRENAAHAAAMTERETAVAAREAQVAQDRAELDRDKQKHRDDKLKLAGDRGMFEETRRLITEGAAEREARARVFDDFQPMQGSGISRDPERRPLRQFPGLTLTAESEPPEAA